MKIELSKAQRIVLRELQLRPHGAPFRGQELKDAVLSLADRQLVCDPHKMGEALFTRITDAGRAALEQGNG